jgi:AmiR/NasT family two-component response regulator
MGPKDDLRREIKRCAADVILVSVPSPDRDIIEQFRESSSENPKPRDVRRRAPSPHGG